MPHSARENDDDVRQWVLDNDIETVLDVGAGSGTYARILRDMVVIDAVEIWPKYVREFKLSSLYRNVVVGDIRDLAWGDSQYTSINPEQEYDLVIFGDVLEHMTKDEALEVWGWASQVARFGLISVPIIHYPQGPEHGNPFEVHVQEHIDLEELRAEFGPFTYDQTYEVTGTFIKEFS